MTTTSKPPCEARINIFTDILFKFKKEFQVHIPHVHTSKINKSKNALKTSKHGRNKEEKIRTNFLARRSVIVGEGTTDIRKKKNQPESQTFLQSFLWSS